MASANTIDAENTGMTQLQSIYNDVSHRIDQFILSQLNKFQEEEEDEADSDDYENDGFDEVERSAKKQLKLQRLKSTTLAKLT